MLTVTYETREAQHLRDLCIRLSAQMNPRKETPACATVATRSTVDNGANHLAARRDGALERKTLCGRFFLCSLPERFDPKLDCQECRQAQEDLA